MIAMGKQKTTFNIQNKALATSGDYMQAFTSDYAHHHIIDPHLGFSSPELASVSVIAPNAVTADALATALMVMGSEGLKLIEKLPHCEAYTVSKELTSSKTTGFMIN